MRTTTRRTLFVLAALLPLVVTAGAHARGLLVPDGATRGTPTWQLESEHLNVEVRGSKAHTVVTQVVRNLTAKPLSARYLIPVPTGTDISRVSVRHAGTPVNGVWRRGDEARKAFETLLRSRKTSPLLRHAGEAFFEARLKPIAANASIKIVLQYDQEIPTNGRIFEWIHRSNAAYAGPSDGIDFSAEVTVLTERRIGPMYCPSFRIETRPGYGESTTAVIKTRLLPHDPDVSLYWAASASRVGATLLTYWPKDEPNGYFLFLAQPAPGTVETRQVRPKSITFVVDASSSMAGEKLAQVRSGLRQIVATLNPKDHFNFIAYNGGATRLWDQPAPVNAQTRREALAFLDGLQTAAGTNIQAALIKAVQARRPDMASAVMLVVDGRPTLGEVNTHKILGAVRSAQGKQPVRIFALGVGVDVNSVLLDRLSLESRGVPSYVGPREDIEPHVIALYERLRYPVLTDVTYRFGGMRAESVLPRTPADLFRGNQMVLAGRYAKGGQVELVVQGRDGVLTRQYHYVLQAAKRGEGVQSDFPARVWATRRVAALIDDIRLHHNQDPTLVDEVVRLATRFGVVTEYTSYLALNVGLSFERNRKATQTSMNAQMALPVGNIAWAQSRNQVVRRATKGVARGAQELYVQGDNDRDVEQVRITGDRGAWPRVITNRTFYRRPDGGWIDALIEDPSQVDEYVVRWSERFFEIVASTDAATHARLAQAGTLLLRIDESTVQIQEPE